MTDVFYDDMVSVTAVLPQIAVVWMLMYRHEWVRKIYVS